MRLELLADRFHPDVPRVAVVGGRAHLDELVRLQRAVDLGEDLVREALVADEHGGRELVRFGAQLAPSFRRELGHRGSISKRALKDFRSHRSPPRA